MTRIAVICGIAGNPRISKRIETLVSSENEVSVIYWNRTHGFGMRLPRQQGARYFEIGGTNVRNPIKRFLETRRLNEETLEKLEKIQPDIVYVMHLECMFSARKYCRKNNSLFVFEVSDLPGAWYLKNLGFLREPLSGILDRIVSSADAFVMTSPFFFTNYYRDRTRIPEERVFVFENVPRRCVFEKIRKEPSKKLRVGFVGGVRYFRSLQTLVEAAKELDDIEVIIAGAGPQIDAVEEISRGSANVTLLGGYDYEKDIARIYSGLDIVYSVYDPEMLNVKLALPNKLYEAIVCEIPIIVASGTCLEEYVKELGVGFSVTHGDVGSLRDLLVTLSRDREILQKISQHESRIKERFFYENIEKNFLEWLEGLKKSR